MPKIVDNYVLERKIGHGQFGEVFKGYNKVNNQDIAVKAVKRELLKGKFNELLDNEIRVLKSCNNENIIKLYDLKKTSNNFYLMLEYCNEGDLSQFLKDRKILTEDESVEFLCQILNGFKTLVKNNIMHRDFKLANILKHNGNIKIADFGFSKLLGSSNLANTMLGSPLNMAPEVLNNQIYDNKADIWSIGTCFYELLFGKPPFTAANMVDLLKNIKNKPLEIPRKINNVSPIVEDVLRKMLVVDPKKRIEWNQLFSHKITYYKEEQIKKELENTLNTQDMNLSLNMSRFYLKNNKVISHPNDIKEKEQLNEFAINIAKQANKQQAGGGNNQQINNNNNNNNNNINNTNTNTNTNNINNTNINNTNINNNNINNNNIQQQQFKGKYVNRQTEREEPNMNQEMTKQKTLDENNQQMEKEETEREKQIKIQKKNSNRILHERNIYVFMASVAEDAMNNQQQQQSVQNVLSQTAGFVLVRKQMKLLERLLNILEQQQNEFNLENWDLFIQSKDYKDILAYIQKEHEVFKVYYQQLQDSISKIILQQHQEINTLLDKQTIQHLLTPQLANSLLDQVYNKVLRLYTQQMLHEQKSALLSQNNTLWDTRQCMGWVQLDRILDCQFIESVFKFEKEQNGIQFNFKAYYDDFTKYEFQPFLERVYYKFNQLQSDHKSS